MRTNKRNTCTVLHGMVNNMEAILQGEATNEAAELLARFGELLVDLLHGSYGEELQANSHALDDVRERLDRLEAGLDDDVDDDDDPSDEDGGDDGGPSPASDAHERRTMGAGQDNPRHGGGTVKRGRNGIIPW